MINQTGLKFIYLSPHEVHKKLEIPVEGCSINSMCNTQSATFAHKRGWHTNTMSLVYQNFLS